MESLSHTMQTIGGRWRARLVCFLGKGPRRFSDLQRDNKGISTRMLALDLRKLEEEGVVERVVYSDHTPVRVEYRLTKEGLSLGAIINDLQLWGKQRDNTNQPTP